jgi:hypothetical protein
MRRRRRRRAGAERRRGEDGERRSGAERRGGWELRTVTGRGDGLSRQQPTRGVVPHTGSAEREMHAAPLCDCLQGACMDVEGGALRQRRRPPGRPAQPHCWQRRARRALLSPHEVRAAAHYARDAAAAARRRGCSHFNLALPFRAKCARRARYSQFVSVARHFRAAYTPGAALPSPSPRPSSGRTRAEELPCPFPAHRPRRCARSRRAAAGGGRTRSASRNELGGDVRGDVVP